MRKEKRGTKLSGNLVLYLWSGSVLQGGPVGTQATTPSMTCDDQASTDCLQSSIGFHGLRCWRSRCSIRMASAQHMSQRAHIGTSLFTWKYHGSTQCSVLISLGHSVPRCLHQVRRRCCRTGGRSNCKASWLAPPSPMLLKRSVSTYPWYGQAPHFYSQISSKISSSSIASHTLLMQMPNMPSSASEQCSIVRQAIQPQRSYLTRNEKKNVCSGQ
jgi:hypothetical protein